MAEDNTLAAQIAVVTGGSRGIGREIALALARQGAHIAVTARDHEKLAETVDLIEAAGGQASAFEMDVTDPSSVKTGIDAIVTQLGPIDMLVNNAGILGERALPWEADVDAWWRVVEVNLRGVFLCAHAVMPSMIARGRGLVINVGSEVAVTPNPLTSAYSVSKTALLRLTDSLHASANEHGVRVFAISPGLVATDMTRAMQADPNMATAPWTPIERAGELCVFLASGKADALAGRYIHASLDDWDDLVARADDIIAHNWHVLALKRAAD